MAGTTSATYDSYMHTYIHIIDLQLVYDLKVTTNRERPGEEGGRGKEGGPE